MGNRARVFDVETGESRDLGTDTEDFVLLSWTRDGRSMLLSARDRLPARMERYDMARGERTLVRELMPTDAAGVPRIETSSIAQDGRYYAYNYSGGWTSCTSWTGCPDRIAACPGGRRRTAAR